MGSGDESHPYMRVTRGRKKGRLISDIIVRNDNLYLSRGYIIASKIKLNNKNSIATYLATFSVGIN